ncbi:anti-sigma-28 factor, FlgM family [Caloramator fervidus]|uniref:Anti-sigma-28 factor, FlgM family n=1 Tax=Caloramator fervidus TaxID=29344 RepID=A0A1H5WLT9_9CLOT|nr:flagellar biosynthesis anti-sigma factor FlgM [Caloramator fervidus]SEF99927.1 anti-sigma-28 factor, FlgM family [Caloramator fervidus]
MRIRFDINNVINVYNKNLSLSKSNSVNKKEDTIEISKAGKEIAKFLELSRNIEIDEGNSEKVERIKKLIKEGKYVVDDELLARSIIQAMKERDK